MTQFPTQSPVLPASDNNGITNPREVAAFVLAELSKTIGTFLVGMTGVLNPLYLWAIHSGNHSLVFVISAGISVMWGIAVLVLFVLLRAMFGGMPTIVLRAPNAGRVTCVAEIGAFVIAYAVVLTVTPAAERVLSWRRFMSHSDAASRRSSGSRRRSSEPCLIFFLFLGLRRAMVSG